MILLICLSVLGVAFAQHNMGQFTGTPPTGPFVPPSDGPSWVSSAELLPNPGASMLAFQFNGPEHGANFITLPRSLSAAVPRTMTLEAWVFLPAKSDRSTQEALPILSRFNVRLQAGPDNLDQHNDFGFEIVGESGELRLWMGGMDVEYGFDLTSRVAVPTGEWAHVAATVVSSESRNPFLAMLFIDGAQVASQNWKSGATRVFQSNEAIALGHRQRGSDLFYFEGVIDEVRVWSTARKADDITRDMTRQLAGDEEGLVALYRLDDFGDRLVHDAGVDAHHGYTVKPIWTLGDAATLERDETGVQGFPVDIAFGAVDLVPTAPSGFEFVLDCLPTNGCVFAPDDPKMECAQEADLGARVFSAAGVHYTANSDYLGPDQLCYRARRIGESDLSEPAIININVVPAPDTGCLSKFDECGVCGGDGTSCTTGGCDGKGGQFDECMVCGGDSSTCMCAVYKSYSLEEMDCILFENAINRTMVRLEHSVGLLQTTLHALASYDPSNRASSFDLLSQVKHLCAIRPCVQQYTDEASVFTDYITEFLKTAPLCEESEPKLLTWHERQRMQ